MTLFFAQLLKEGETLPLRRGCRSSVRGVCEENSAKSRL